MTYIIGVWKKKEAEEMYQRALAGYEKALGPNHTSTLVTVNNLGNLIHLFCLFQLPLIFIENAKVVHCIQSGRMIWTEGMYQRALAGYEKALGPNHTSTLVTVNNLGNLFSDFQLPLIFIENAKVVHCIQSGRMIWTEGLLLAYQPSVQIIRPLWIQ
jgi:hypothetical protein